MYGGSGKQEGWIIMKMESVRYSAERNEPFWHEEIDDIGRYLRLAAEFGCTEQGGGALPLSRKRAARREERL